MTKILRVLIGLPASGKSTYAMNLLKEEENWFRISRDDIRMTMFGKEHDPKIEGFVSKIQNMLLLKALKSDKNVVVDNCNIKESYRNDLYKLAELIGDVQYEEIVFDTPLEICLERNKKRDRKVPEDVLHRFAKAAQGVLGRKYKAKNVYIALQSSCVLDQDENLPKALICDLDGTMALMNGRNPYDASTCDQDLPNYPVIETIKNYDSDGYKIIFCSGREDKFKEPTIRFIEKYFTNVDHVSNIEFVRPYELFMRKTGDQRKDAIIKREIFQENIYNKYNVLFVLDDRDQVVKNWRDMGLTCFQVQEGDF